jgi:phage terminase small subunit
MTSKANELANQDEAQGDSSVPFQGGASARRRRFAAEYVRNGFRGTAAAIKAGYSPKSARFIASELLANPNIAQQVRELTQLEFDQAQMNANEVLARLASIARADFRKFVDDDGKFIPVQDLDSDIAGAVKEVRVTRARLVKGVDMTETETTVLKVEGRVPALQLLARYHRLIEADPAPIMPAPGQLDIQARIELARRIAFALTRASAQL